MAYLRPPALTRRLFNPLAMRLHVGGSAALEVRRRKSGTIQRVPVIPLDHAGARYVVSTRGESDWVRNVRDAGTVVLAEKGRSGRYTTTEVPAGEREPIIEAYRRKAGRTVESYWRALPSASDHPTFRLEPLG
jgi:F420H(2)-dependent quinone reductase